MGGFQSVHVEVRRRFRLWTLCAHQPLFFAVAEAVVDGNRIACAVAGILPLWRALDLTQATSNTRSHSETVCLAFWILISLFHHSLQKARRPDPATTQKKRQRPAGPGRGLGVPLHSRLNWSSSCVRLRDVVARELLVLP